METPVTPKDDEKKEKTTDTLTKSLEKHAPLKRRGHKRSHRRVRSGSIDDDLSPWPLPKTKKKKKKSQRKRRRHRSPSCSPSPVRKKKKKKSSKKRKRHRSASRKGRHRSGSHSHRRHRRRKAAIRNPSWLENRYCCRLIGRPI
ncbi:hypothetical protein DNTS_023062 [Danionella cerebrum]|uniref:Uncharacterized protein n=1 Tax=Danionella cerebrum TaxID=2873325 RepID=A0A553RFG4_9TELE|nr:hypothetical protein DNTS_023062 [Danionella translucida]